jgi:hypothetical protein
MEGGVMNEPALNLAPGYLVLHESLGVGLVLNVEGAGHRAQAHVDFDGSQIWVVIANHSLTIVHKRLEESHGRALSVHQ